MQKLEMLIKTVDAHYDSLHQIQCFYLSCSLLNIARGTCNMMIVSEDSDFKNKITISENIPKLKNIFLRLFLAREPTNPDIIYNLFTSLSMSKIY